MRRVCGVTLLWLALSGPAMGENGYRNVVNARHDTIANGPMGQAVIDVADPSRPTEETTRLPRPAGRSRAARQAPAWFRLLQRQRMLPADQPWPVLPLTVIHRHNGRLVLPELNPTSRQADTLGNDANRLTFNFEVPAGDPNARAWAAGQQSALLSFLNDIEPVLRRIYGPPAFNLTVNIVHDPSLNALNMVTYNPSSNQIRLELLNDVDSAEPTLTPLDDYDFYTLTYAVLKAYHDDVFLYFDAWEEGLARAAQLLVIAQARPDFGFLARDFNLLFTAYDVLNQPGLESPTFLGEEGGTESQTMREALATIRAYLAQAAWLKAYAENPELFVRFNDAYYDAMRVPPQSTAGNVPILKTLMRQAAPQVEGIAFDDWYRRQYVLDTSVIPGAKLYVFNIPQKDFITGEPTNSLPMNVYHFEVTPTNVERPLTGTVRFSYFAYDGFDLTNAVEGASGSSGIEARIGEAGNPAGIGSAVPLFFNIAGDQQVQQQRIEVFARVNGMERMLYFPNDVAADDTQVRNHVYGLVTNGFQGTVEIAIQGKQPITANVIQGAFKVKIPGGLPTPATATLTWTPDTSGGAQAGVVRRNVMFLGPLGSGVDVETGDAILILETPPETLRPFQQAIPAGLAMITIPAFAIRENAASVLGIDATALRLARADGAVPGFEPYRQGSLYRLWPNTPAFRPGYAYWFHSDEAATLQFDGVEANRDRPFRQHYPPGWQQIGNPYNDLNILFQNLQVQAADGSDAVSLAQAQTQGLVSSGIFRYNRAGGGYELVAPGGTMTPYEGYWLNILAARGATLIYPNQVAVARSRASRGRVMGQPTDWRLGLVARSGDHEDRALQVGVAPGAGDGYSRSDLAKPPPFGPFLQVSVPRDNWGGAAGRYAVDLREGDGGPKSWDLLVESTLPSREVTLSWPDLAQVPANVALTLTDLETGRSRYLRTTASYSFNLGEGGRRLLRLTAERPNAAGLAVTSLEVRPSRAGGSISFGLTAPAEVTVTLNSQSGRLLQTVVRSRASTRGVNDVAFVARDEQNRPLPNGIYRLDLIAVGSDGRQVRNSRMVRVER